jgi:hypothetical protein
MSNKPATETPKRGRGRPAKGLQPGETVTSYRRLTVRLPAESKARLMAIAEVTKTPAWLLVTQAVDLLWDRTPSAERQLAGRLAKVNAAHYAETE